MQRFIGFLTRQSESFSDRFNDFVRQTELDNGIKLASQRRFKDKKIRFCMQIEAGSIDDPADKPGVAHLLEHILYTPSQKHEFESRGGNVSLGTTGRSIEVEGELDRSDENLEFLMNYLRDVLTRDITQEELDRERDGILNEIGMMADDPEKFTRFVLSRKIFERAHSPCCDLGSKNDIRAMIAGDLNDFRRTHFVGENISLALTGVSDHDKLHDMAQMTLGNIAAGIKQPHPEIRLKPSEIRTGSERVEQLYLNLYFPFEIQHERDMEIAFTASRYLLQKMQDMLLFGPKRLVYGYALHVPSHDVQGTFRTELNVLPDNAQNVFPALAEIWAEGALDLDRDTFDKIQKRSRDGYDGDASFWPMKTRTAASLAFNLMDKGRQPTVKAQKELEFGVTAEEVQDFIARAIENEPALVAYGNSENLQSREEFMAMLEAEKQRYAVNSGPATESSSPALNNFA